MFLIEDFRQAWLGIAKSPAYLALSAGVLALGLGATIFIYGVVVTILQTPPPFERPDRLRLMNAAEPAQGSLDERFHYLDYQELKEQTETFDDLAAYNIGSMIVSGTGGVPARMQGAWATPNLFQVLGVAPTLGRSFAADDGAPNAEAVAILGYDVWRTQFNADPQTIGKVIRIGGTPTTVVGVAPRSFSFPFTQEIWVPIRTSRADTPRGTQGAPEHQLVGRMRDGVTEQQAADEFATIAARLAQQYPQTNGGLTTHVMPVANSVVGVSGAKLIYAIFGCVWLVLLIACANVASLSFVRANLRVHEASMRVALGATRGRLIVQMLAENVIVSVVAMFGGLAIAALALRGLQIALPAMTDRPLPAWWQFSVDAKVAAFAALAALLSGLIAGIVPALRASRPDVMKILRDGGRTGTGMQLGRFAAVMVVLEIALSAALLTTAGLLTRDALLSLQRDIGADVRGFMSGRVGVPGYSLEESARFYERLATELAAKPGVQAVAAASGMPGLGAEVITFGIEGQTYEGMHNKPRGQSINILPGFFKAFGLPILSGRDFDSRDRADAVRVALVNQTFARKHFGTESPVGKRIQMGMSMSMSMGMGMNTEQPWVTIIGVVPDIQHLTEWSSGGQFSPAIYTSASQVQTFLTFGIKGSGDPGIYAKTLLDTLRDIDPDVAVYFLRTIAEQQEIARGIYRVLAMVVTCFAGIAIILAAVGIYGTLVFATRQRTREIGLRRALGAQNRNILNAVIRGAAVQLSIGLGVAAVLCPLMPRVLGGTLQGLPKDDARIYAVVFGILILVVLLASWVPAIRALRVQPAVALRVE